MVAGAVVPIPTLPSAVILALSLSPLVFNCNSPPLLTTYVFVLRKYLDVDPKLETTLVIGNISLFTLKSSAVIVPLALILLEAVTAPSK